MGKARTPGAPWYLRPLALLIAGVLLCVVGVCYGRARLAGRQAEAQRAGQVARRGCPLALGQDLVRHALFRYQTRASLPRAYFARAEAALGDGYIYLVLAQSKSPAGEVIGLFTHRDYNHISLALDADLDTLVSYNGGEGIAFPGLNRETVPGLARRAGASLLVYRLPATRHQKQIILRRLGKINQEGSAYNLLGLLFSVAWQPNQMFCSQFVYRMLRLAGLHYFRKDPFQVRPMDFVDLDAQGALTLVAAYTRVGGRLLARKARPLPAGWQASA